MSVRVLLGHQWHRHRVTLLVLATGVSLFEWIFTRLAPAPEQAGLVRDMMALFPRPLVALIPPELLENVTPGGFLGFGYLHPFLLLLLSLWTVRVSAGALAGEIGIGTMDLIAARPVARAAQVLAAALALFAGLAVLGAAGWGGTALGIAGRPLPGVEAGQYVRVVVGCWLLFAAIGALGLAISAARREGGSAIAWTSAIVALSFVLDYLGRAWDTAAPFRFLSLFRYYEPSRILRDGLAGTDAVVLASVALFGVLAAFVVFQRRDL